MTAMFLFGGYYTPTQGPPYPNFYLRVATPRRVPPTPSSMWGHKDRYVVQFTGWLLQLLQSLLNSVYSHPPSADSLHCHLLSSLEWIDSGVAVWQHGLESFFHEIKCSCMASFMEFMCNSTIAKFYLRPTGANQWTAVSRKWSKWLITGIGGLGCHRDTAWFGVFLSWNKM